MNPAGGDKGEPCPNAGFETRPLGRDGTGNAGVLMPIVGDDSPLDIEPGLGGDFGSDIRRGGGTGQALG